MKRISIGVVVAVIAVLTVPVLSHASDNSDVSFVPDLPTRNPTRVGGKLQDRLPKGGASVDKRKKYAVCNLEDIMRARSHKTPPPEPIVFWAQVVSVGGGQFGIKDLQVACKSSAGTTQAKATLAIPSTGIVDKVKKFVTFGKQKTVTKQSSQCKISDKVITFILNSDMKTIKVKCGPDIQNPVPGNGGTPPPNNGAGQGGQTPPSGGTLSPQTPPPGGGGGGDVPSGDGYTVPGDLDGDGQLSEREKFLQELMKMQPQGDGGQDTGPVQGSGNSWDGYDPWAEEQDPWSDFGGYGTHASGTNSGDGLDISSEDDLFGDEEGWDDDWSDGDWGDDSWGGAQEGDGGFENPVDTSVSGDTSGDTEDINAGVERSGDGSVDYGLYGDVSDIADYPNRYTELTDELGTLAQGGDMQIYDLGDVSASAEMMDAEYKDNFYQYNLADMSYDDYVEMYGGNNTLSREEWNGMSAVQRFIYYQGNASAWTFNVNDAYTDFTEDEINDASGHGTLYRWTIGWWWDPIANFFNPKYSM